MKGSMIVLLILLALVALFTVQNPEVVTVKFLSFTGNTLLVAVIVASFGAGVLGAGLVALPSYFRRRSEASSAKQRIRELEAEVKSLKAEIEHLKGKPPPSKTGGTA